MGVGVLRHHQSSLTSLDSHLHGNDGLSTANVKRHVIPESSGIQYAGGSERSLLPFARGECTTRSHKRERAGVRRPRPVAESAERAIYLYLFGYDKGWLAEPYAVVDAISIVFAKRRSWMWL